MGRRLPQGVLDFVEKLLVQGVEKSRIRKTVMQEYNVSERTVTNYIRQVYERWDAESVENRGYRREAMRRTLQSVFENCVETRKFKDALSALDKLCKIDGLYVPEEVKIEHVNHQVRAREKTPAERQRRLQELLDKKKEQETNN